MTYKHMTSKEALEIMKNIIKKLFEDDIKALAFLMNEEVEGKEIFLKDNILELKNICELSLEELENDKH